MKSVRLLVALLCTLAVFAGSHAFAQDTQATPVPFESPPANPHVYDDAAMHFQAPANYKLLGERHIPLKDVGDAVMVAAWVKLPGDPNERDLFITIEGYSGDATGYEETVENNLRDQFDDALVSHKEELTTSNGMPAYLMTISYGSGFDAKKRYQLVWSDGQRGVSIAIVGEQGQLTEKEARAALLTDVTAVAYPPNAP